MAPRAHWKGFLKLSLVACPVALYPAISAAERISFRQVNKETGNRLRQQLVDTATGEVIASYNKGRGYEVGENEFLVVEHEELAAVQREARERPFNSPAARSLTTPPTQKQPVKASEPTRRAERAREETASPIVSPPEPPRPIVENNRTIELDRFVRPKEIDAAYYNMPYFIVPRDAVGQEAFAVIRDAMAHKKLVGLGPVVLASRERPI